MVNKCLVKFGFFCSVFTVFLLNGFPVFAGDYFYKVAAKKSPSDLLGTISFRDNNLRVLISSVNYKEFMEHDAILVGSSALLQLMKDLHTASLDAEFNYAMLRLSKAKQKSVRETHDCNWTHIEKSKCQFIKKGKVIKASLDKWFMFNDEFHSAMNESDTNTQDDERRDAALDCPEDTLFEPSANSIGSQGLARKKVISFVYVDPFVELLQDEGREDYMRPYSYGYDSNKEWCLLPDQQQYSYIPNGYSKPTWFVRSTSTQLTFHTAGKLKFTCGDWVFIPCTKDEYTQLLKNMTKGQTKEKTPVSSLPPQISQSAPQSLGAYYATYEDNKGNRVITGQADLEEAARLYKTMKAKNEKELEEVKKEAEDSGSSLEEVAKKRGVALNLDETTAVSWMKDEDKRVATKGKSGRNIINEFNNDSVARPDSTVKQRHSKK